MHTNSHARPDLDAITRNLIALDLAHVTPEESATYEQELSAITKPSKGIAALNEILKTNVVGIYPS